jgi:hypothetical protein
MYKKGGKMTRFSKLDFGQERRLISSTEGGEPYNLAQNSHRGLYRLGRSNTRSFLSSGSIFHLGHKSIGLCP